MTTPTSNNHILSSLVNVSIESAYISSQSNENELQFVYSYTITIKNNSEEALKLLSRYWLITDSNGDESTVSGEGVVGEQPLIQPQKSYTYSSGCLLKTPVGTMQGHYQMLNQGNELVQVEIPVFRLAKPNILN